MTSYKNTVTPSSVSETLMGRVKWFNNKAGYGFITVVDTEQNVTDIFVHHSAIVAESEQYKYLIQGEYVEFVMIKTESDKHEWQASNVCGIKGGKLMCETRRESNVARSEYKTVRPDATPSTPRQQGAPTVISSQTSRHVKQPRTTVTPSDVETKDWNLISNNKVRKPRSVPK